MGCKGKITAAMGALVVVTASASGAVIFSQFSIDEVATVGQLQSAAQAGSTAAVAGVAAEPGATGDVFAIHADGAQSESFLRVSPEGSAASKLTDAAMIGQQLGAPYGSSIALAGGFAFAPTANELYFGEDFYGTAAEASVIGLNADTGAARLVTRSSGLSGLSDLSVMPDGTINVALSSPGSAVGTINPVTGAYTPKLNEAALLAASPGSSSLPPEAIAVDPVSGKTYVSAHGDLDVFEIVDLTAASPVAARLDYTELSGADVHDLAVDQYGNLYGLDVAGNRIVIVRSTDKQVFSFPLNQIAMQLGRPTFAAVPWRGIAARVAGYSQTDLFLSSGNSDYGIVRVRFGAVASAVTDWTMY